MPQFPINIPRCPIEAYAHRGLSLNCPENTLQAFAAAASTGTCWIETDVHTTEDGVVVVFHDCTLNRVAGVSGRITDMTWAQLSRIELPGGHRIPSLEEALITFPALYFNIDIKDPGSALHLPAVLARTGAVDRVRVASFSHRRRRATLHRLRKLVPRQSIQTSASQLDMYVFYALAHSLPVLWPLAARLLRLVSEPFDSMQIPRTHRILGRQVPVLTSKLLRTAHRYGFSVQVWTIDNPAEMRELAAMGVDGIVSNRVDLLQKM